MAMIAKTLEQLFQQCDLTFDQMCQLMRQLMQGDLQDMQITALLTALRCKGETANEIAAAATVMRELMLPVTLDLPHLVDTCGTGGDGADLFNVSTAAAFVAAAGGAHVAKHGNRSVSSQSGSADVLQQLGLSLELSPETLSRCIETVGIGFLFAPNHHKAMKYAAAPRQALGVRTLFNLLGPLTNPARVKRQVVGVFDAKWLQPMAQAFKQLGSEHVLVVHADDGLDEFSVSAPTQVCELKHEKITCYTVKAGDFGLEQRSLDACVIKSPQDSAAVIKAVFENKRSDSAYDMVALNAGAIIYVAGLTPSLALGVDMAQDIISTGLANEKLKQLIQFSTLSL